MKKICVFASNRANYARLKSVIDAIHKHNKFELQLILASSIYNIDCEYDVSARVQCLVDGDNNGAMALTNGLLNVQLVQELHRLKPDLVFIHGDRYEVLAMATAASYMNIPIAHTEGGEITSCIDDKVRNAITQLADIHFTTTKNSMFRVLNLFQRENVYCVGSTALDSIKYIREKPKINGNYVVVLMNPDTKEQEYIMPLVNALDKIDIKKYWVNPNVDAGSKDILKQVHKLKNIEFVKGLNNIEYAELIYNSICLIGNTSSGIKEGSFLGVLYICVGTRQLGREHDKNTIFASMDENINHALDIVLDNEYYGYNIQPSNYFGDGNASGKIMKILEEIL